MNNNNNHYYVHLTCDFHVECCAYIMHVLLVFGDVLGDRAYTDLYTV